MPEIVMIAALAKNNRVIGNKNDLPWHIQEDLQHFKKHTLRRPLIMGRTTFDAILQQFGKMLPNRRIVVLTHTGEIPDYPHIETVASVDEAMALLANEPIVYIGGGANVYEQFLPLADRLELTEIDGAFIGDTFFPAYKQLIGSEFLETASRQRDGYRFITYRRKPAMADKKRVHAAKTPAEFWNARYESEEFAYGVSANDFLIASAGKIPTNKEFGGTVLCLASGEGRNAVYLATLGYDVTAVDFSSEGLKKTESLAHKHNVSVRTVRADLNDLTIQSESWDGIISIFCHLPPAGREKLYKQAAAGLKKGGVFILEGYAPDQVNYNSGGPGKPALFYTVPMLTNDLAGLSILHGKEITRNIIEGEFHNGEAAVTQIIAQNI